MIEVFRSEDRGRGLRATTDLRKGTLVLTSAPFAYVLSKKQKGIRCDHCLNKQTTLLRCSGCKYMKYCNRECQKGAWSSHKSECTALKRVEPKIPPDFVILLSRILWKLKSTDDNWSENLVSVVDLESNYTLLSDDQKEALGQFVIVMHSYWGQGALPVQVPDIKAVLELCSKIKNNSFAISDEEMQADIGTGVYLSCSLLNHSCDPNCVAEFDEMNINIRAIKDISKGEELLISYVDVFAPSEDRQKDLMDIYKFSCRCNLCRTKKHDRSMLQDFKSSMTISKQNSVKDLLHELHNLCDARNFQQIYNITSGYVEREYLPVENIYMTKILDFAMDAAIELKMFGRAFQHGAAALHAYRKYLDESHPLTGLQIMKLGKILLYQEKNEDALQMLLEALKILQITYSKTGIIMQSLTKLVAQCQVELRHKNLGE
ncbi:histone-lysine N-methyltransferase SMYD3-like isoform X2 [Clavelina lepadiformis]|uniref:histone-lysine N-methyltransferase SMYD3-like isoform X2 n=1 Tax=Clavelina lepadiformis TaxID=159417 RepID=UPI0040421B06